MIILCTVDITTREVAIPSDQRIASYDHNADVIRFQVETIPGFSLDTSSIKIAAKGPNKVRHDYAVDPSTVQIEEETGYITFDWPIPQGVTEMPEDMFGYGATGQLIFAVCAEIISGSTVSKAWHSDDGIITVVAHLEPEAGGGEDPSEEATNAQKIGQLQTDVAVVQREVAAVAGGTPTVVDSVSDMADTNKIYVLSTDSKWYYHNGSAWQIGGVYGGAVTSTTFNQHGVPADDFAVGLALAEKADADDVTALEGDVGDLSQLTTTAKDNLVSAINEANDRLTDVRADLDAETQLSVKRNLFEENGKTMIPAIFQNGTWAGGVFSTATAYNYRVGMPNYVEFDRDITLMAESGYTMRIVDFNSDGTFHGQKADNVETYTITANTKFAITVKNTANETAKQKADISIYASAVTFTNYAKAVGDAIAEKADADEIGDLSQLTTTAKDNLVSAINEVAEDAKAVGDTFVPFVLSVSDLEDGAIQNGTGENKNGSHRVRTKTYIPATKGSVITFDKVRINVWEYDLLTKQYLTDYGNFTNTYTVNNDCYIRIMWNSAKAGTTEDYTYEELIASTTLDSMTLRNSLIDQSFIKDLAVNVVSDVVTNEVVPRSQRSNTIKTIAHRGDDIVAPQCTAPAYILARKHGHTIAENDLWLSEDGEFVMWHDTSLARLGNLVDINGYLMYTDGTDYYWVHPTTQAVYTWSGSAYVASAVSLSSLTRCAGGDYGVNSQYNVIGLDLAVLKRIDFGVYKDAKFAGTQILTFAEWVLLCKQLGMEIYVDKKLSYTDALLTQAANIVKLYGMGEHASWLGLYNISQINLVRSIIPDARVGILRHPSAEDIATYTNVNTGRGFFFNGDANTMTAETIQMGLDAGFDVEVWYVDYGLATKEQVFDVFRSAVQYGVTGITTDHYRSDEAFDYLLEQY